MFNSFQKNFYISALATLDFGSEVYKLFKNYKNKTNFLKDLLQFCENGEIKEIFLVNFVKMLEILRKLSGNFKIILWGNFRIILWNYYKIMIKI